MSEAKAGEEFVKHEFDEAIAIQEAIVEGERALATSHPAAEVKRTLKSMLKDDQSFLKDLRRLGRQHDATGVAEEVAEPLVELMEMTASSAGEAESEAYEAHAVLITLKRKQQDSAAAILMIAREPGG
jgi:Skp family chaperone for outer membrane proteins